LERFYIALQYKLFLNDSKCLSGRGLEWPYIPASVFWFLPASPPYLYLGVCSQCPAKRPNI